MKEGVFAYAVSDAVFGKLRKSGADFEIKAMLYLLNFRKAPIVRRSTILS